MADFRVLTDSDVQTLLRSADQAEILQFADILLKTLQTYSTTDEAEHQPHRAAVKRKLTTGDGDGDGDQGTLFMPSTSPDALGVKIVGLPPPSSKAGLAATMTVCSATGRARGVLNAGELTAFRTSLGAMLLFRRRRHVQNLVMFGAGKQAYWHIRLALLLRGSDIRSVTVVNRSHGRSEELVSALRKNYQDSPSMFGGGGGGGGGGSSSSSTTDPKEFHFEMQTLSPEDEHYDQKLEEAVTQATSIHCAVPSTTPLFPADWILPLSSDKNPPYISAIGSYRLDMQELDPQLFISLLSSTAPSLNLNLPDRPDPVAVIVDSRAACFQEAGEIVAAGLKSNQILEIGELGALLDQKKNTAELEGWLETGGPVVYKSVGIGVMDLCIATALLDLAERKNVGVAVEHFSS